MKGNQDDFCVTHRLPDFCNWTKVGKILMEKCIQKSQDDLHWSLRWIKKDHYFFLQLFFWHQNYLLQLGLGDRGFASILEFSAQQLARVCYSTELLVHSVYERHNYRSFSTLPELRYGCAAGFGDKLYSSSQFYCDMRAIYISSALSRLVVICRYCLQLSYL